MASVLSYLRELNIVTMMLRILLAVLCGGLIGLERERKNRPAGFRTYMLTALGATLTVLLSLQLDQMLHGPWRALAESIGATQDVSRFGAEAAKGIGFLGAGTILVTGRQEVKGLTTAAALWTCACMGLSVVAGFYECVFIGFAFIFICIKFFPAIENYFMTHTGNLNIYVKFSSVTDVGEILDLLRRMEISVHEMELDKTAQFDADGAIFALRLPRGTEHAQVAAEIAGLKCVKGVEEI